MNTSKYVELLKMNALKYGYKIKSDERLNVLAGKFKQQKEQYGEMYCPCQPNKTPETICPCRYMTKYGACRCGLYERDNSEGRLKEDANA